MLDQNSACDSMVRGVLKKLFAKSSTAWQTRQTETKVSKVVAMLNTAARWGPVPCSILSSVRSSAANHLAFSLAIPGYGKHCGQGGQYPLVQFLDSFSRFLRLPGNLYCLTVNHPLWGCEASWLPVSISPQQWREN